MINDIVLYGVEERLEKEFFGVISFLNVKFGYRKSHIVVTFEPAYDESHKIELKLDLAEEEEELYDDIKAAIKDELRYTIGELKNFIRRSEEIGIF